MQRGELFRIHWHSYDTETARVELKYDLDGEDFTEAYHLPGTCTGGNHEVVERLLGTLHVIAGISYYKTSLPKTVEINHPVSPADAAFFQNVYEKGLGELFFKNDIDPRGIVAIAPNMETAPAHAPAPAAKKRLRVLVPFGGGKDSVVTAMLLKEAGHDVTLLRVGAHGAIDALAKMLGLPMLIVDRRLDPKLFEINAKGGLNGHVPITAILSALAMLVAETAGYDAVAFSNERSASEGNTVFNDLEINHQWSKSLEFERAFRTHLRDTCGTAVEFVSLLRPWSELRIVREFVRFKEALLLFTSCNRNWHIGGSKVKKGLWCGICPKCAFTGVLLAAFIPRERVSAIQGSDVLTNPANVELYEELLGLRGHKPFECVGTPQEAAAAFHLARANNGYEDSPAMKRYLDSPLAKEGDRLAEEALVPSDEHCLPPALLAALPRP